jgi:hypothetical protein
MRTASISSNPSGGGFVRLVLIFGIRMRQWVGPSCFLDQILSLEVHQHGQKYSRKFKSLMFPVSSRFPSRQGRHTCSTASPTNSLTSAIERTWETMQPGYTFLNLTLLWVNTWATFKTLNRRWAAKQSTRSSRFQQKTRRDMKTCLSVWVVWV